MHGSIIATRQIRVALIWGLQECARHLLTLLHCEIDLFHSFFSEHTKQNAILQHFVVSIGNFLFEFDDDASPPHSFAFVHI